jgi:two-component system chemotaxis response regulator CheY
MIKLSKVLIVDDEPHVLSYVSMLLRATFGELEISQASNAIEAVDLFTREKPDLVLLDLNLIGTSGLEVLRTIIQLDPDAVVVVLSSVSNRRSVEQAAEFGASGYLLKELPHEELAAAIKDQVEQLFGDDEPTDGPGAP